MSGSIWYDCAHVPGKTRNGGDLAFVGSYTPSGPMWLQGLLGVDFLSDVILLRSASDPSVTTRAGVSSFYGGDVTGPGLSDGDLRHVPVPTDLQVLLLADSQVTDAGLAHLEALTNLRILNLRGAQVTDAGLAHLEGLTELLTLDLHHVQVTDAGLAHLEELTKLSYLGLSGTQVTDAGLVHLEGLTNLNLIQLHGTQVTDAGVQRLRKALPDCGIYH